ncbi:hypothetical protein CONLIGDRAFT_638596 [Coniochaeta ligniaria NRRL 30616]|uniref:Uncharacterized protein n=1 Tax=Coniochaeta ligniaria NRRL 30616 TaxID=1408157 RepID=A0A1J7J3K2_9PEZI|nr:hypothetical protein CONLIGDRAFT_638596 [Coniochaeta ligniaria NRRL 30616]
MDSSFLYFTTSRNHDGTAITGHLLTLGFISYVVKPHMQKIYGRDLRQEAGLTKFIKKSLPPPAKELQQSVDRVLDETRHFVDDFVEADRSKLVAGSSSMAKDTTALFKKYHRGGQLNAS